MKPLLFFCLLVCLTACTTTCPPEPDSTCIDAALVDKDAFCTADVTPVCGCDGKTYNNSCEAKRAGVVSSTPGACR